MCKLTVQAEIPDLHQSDHNYSLLYKSTFVVLFKIVLRCQATISVRRYTVPNHKITIIYSKYWDVDGTQYRYHWKNKLQVLRVLARQYVAIFKLNFCCYTYYYYYIISLYYFKFSAILNECQELLIIISSAGPPYYLGYKVQALYPIQDNMNNFSDQNS